MNYTAGREVAGHGRRRRRKDRLFLDEGSLDFKKNKSVLSEKHARIVDMLNARADLVELYAFYGLSREISGGSQCNFGGVYDWFESILI